MPFDLTATELVHYAKTLGGIILDHFLVFVLYAFIGFILGVLLVSVLGLIARKRNWYNRVFESLRPRIFFAITRFLFNVGIIGLSITVAINLGSNKIIEKETHRLVEKSIKHYKATYFDNFENSKKVFDEISKLWGKGADLKDFNYALADELSQTQGLGWLDYILIDRKQTVQQLESIEKGVFLIFIVKGFEEIGAEGFVNENQLDQLFYKWVHSENGDAIGDINDMISRQITRQIRPFVFSIYLPFYLLNLFCIVLFVLENLWYKKKVSIKATKSDSA